MTSSLQKLSILDRSPRGILELTGADRETFLQGMVSNNVVGLAAGDTRHAALLDTTGHILADLHIHARPDTLVIETDPTCLEVLSATLNKFLIMEDVQIADISSDYAIISVLFGIDGAEHLPVLKLWTSSTSFPVTAGIDFWVPVAEKDTVWNELLDAGAAPLSAENAEALRVDAGIPKWGAELSPAILLPEAEMTDAVSYTKGCYVGQEIVARLQARGHTNKALRRILLSEDAPVPPIGATIHVPEDGPEPGREIGTVTSAAASPSRGGQALALGYVRKEYFDAGTAVSVQITQPNGLVFSYPAEVQ